MLLCSGAGILLSTRQSWWVFLVQSILNVPYHLHISHLWWCKTSCCLYIIAVCAVYFQVCCLFSKVLANRSFSILFSSSRIKLFVLILFNGSCMYVICECVFLRMFVFSFSFRRLLPGRAWVPIWRAVRQLCLQLSADLAGEHSGHHQGSHGVQPGQPHHVTVPHPHCQTHEAGGVWAGPVAGYLPGTQGTLPMLCCVCLWVSLC